MESNTSMKTFIHTQGDCGGEHQCANATELWLIDRGVPAIAVLESDGKLLFSQKRGEFEALRSLAPEDILDFLSKWKPNTARN